MVRDILCYHGTSLANAEKITTLKAYEHGTKRNDHWLGYGSYFFEEDLEQASIWGRFRYKSEVTATLETVLSVNRDLILNLNARQGRRKLRDYLVEFEKTGIEIELDGELPVKPILANMLFSSISEDELWVIIRSFPVISKQDENDSVGKLSFLHQGKSIDYSLLSPQVCVKNLKAIEPKSIKIVCKAQPMNQRKKRAKVIEGRMSYDLYNK